MKSFDGPLLQIFAAEQNEHVARIRELADLFGRVAPESNPTAFDELFRRAHTLKGAARAVGLEQTELLVHRLEDMLSRVRQGDLALDARALRALRNAMDAAEDILAAALGNRREPDVRAVVASVEEILGTTTTHATAPQPEPPPAAPAPVSTPAVSELVRINAENVDKLIRIAAQLRAATSSTSIPEKLLGEHVERLEGTSKEWSRLRKSLGEYLRSHRQDDDFALLNDTLSYMDREVGVLMRQARSAATSLQNRNVGFQQRTDELYQSACDIRMSPAETVFAGFGPMVRELAQREGKEVEFRAEGLEFQADRLVLQALKDPVTQLLRNAVSHGIESREERTGRGKPASGTIRLRIRSRGDRMNLMVEDDGRGLNSRAVMQEARKRGLISDTGESADPAEIAKLIFAPGFSTAKVITHVSGRGMGLSIVQEAVNRLQGEIGIRPARSGGTRISISVPIAISTQHLLLMQVSGQTFGLSSSFVDRLTRIRASEIRNVNGHDSIIVDSDPVPVSSLADVLGLARTASGNAEDAKGEPVLQVLVLTSGEEQAAILVDRFLDERDAIIKDTGLPVALAGFTAGAVPLDDGTVAVVLNATELFARVRSGEPFSAATIAVKKPEKRESRILIVDDSITTRSLEKSILEAHGYRVQVAVDGLQALEKLRAEPVDLVISDVMMPRLNGLQLLEQMKSNRDLKNIPVILVTSLESREDQERGLSLGADAYIVKRKFDQRELLSIIGQIL